MTTLSVIVCTYTMRRRSDVVAAVRSAASQLVDDDEIVVVVDHNPELRMALESEYLDARIIDSSEEPGLSGARNTGASAAASRVLVFLDDDAVLRPGSLDRVRQLFVDPCVSMIGGAVHADWEGDREPWWFPPEFGWVVGCDYVGLPGDGAIVRNPIGAAMAVRADALTSAGGFATELGRVGTLPAGCEETAMGIAIRERDPAARIVRAVEFAVDHRVPVERQSLRYFMSRCFHEGRSKAALSALVGAQAGLSAERSFVVRTLTGSSLRYLLQTLRGRPSSVIRLLVMILGLLCTAAGLVTAEWRPSQPKQVLPPLPAGGTVSVVVPTVGRDTLRATVAALLDQTHRDLEIIVVDNSPDSGRVDSILGDVDDPRLLVARQPVPGASAARNLGATQAQGALVAFTDDDAEPDVRWVASLAATFADDANASVAAVTGRVVGVDVDTDAARWFESAGIFDKGAVATVWSVKPVPGAEMLGETPEPSAFFPVTCGEVGSSNNCCVRRDVLDAVGGFDELLGPGTPTHGGEDLDLFRRLLERGHTIVYRPDAVVGHHHRADTEALRRQMFGYGVGMSAVLTSMTFGGSAADVLRRVPAGVRSLLSPHSDRNRARPSAMPRSLVWVEFAGYLLGPVAYVRSRHGARRDGRRVRARGNR